jgi:hypothetical protein
MERVAPPRSKPANLAGYLEALTGRYFRPGSAGG